MRGSPLLLCLAVSTRLSSSSPSAQQGGPAVQISAAGVVSPAAEVLQFEASHPKGAASLAQEAGGEKEPGDLRWASRQASPKEEDPSACPYENADNPLTIKLCHILIGSRQQVAGKLERAVKGLLLRPKHPNETQWFLPDAAEDGYMKDLKASLWTLWFCAKRTAPDPPCNPLTETDSTVKDAREKAFALLDTIKAQGFPGIKNVTVLTNGVLDASAPLSEYDETAPGAAGSAAESSSVGSAPISFVQEASSTHRQHSAPTAQSKSKPLEIRRLPTYEEALKLREKHREQARALMALFGKKVDFEELKRKTLPKDRVHHLLNGSMLMNLGSKTPPAPGDDEKKDDKKEDGEKATQVSEQAAKRTAFIISPPNASGKIWDAINICDRALSDMEDQVALEKNKDLSMEKVKADVEIMQECATMPACGGPGPSIQNGFAEKDCCDPAEPEDAKYKQARMAMYKNVHLIFAASSLEAQKLRDALDINKKDDGTGAAAPPAPAPTGEQVVPRNPYPAVDERGTANITEPKPASVPVAEQGVVFLASLAAVTGIVVIVVFSLVTARPKRGPPGGGGYGGEEAWGGEGEWGGEGY